MATDLLTRLKNWEILVCDGAMGTMLHQAGLQPGECAELWNLEKPDKIAAIHTAYINAGCDMVITNTFGGNWYKLKKYNLENQVEELNRAGVKVAQQAIRVNPGIFILGDIGPTGEILEPVGEATYDELHTAFSEQASALAAVGVDAIVIETMSAIEEAVCAVKAAKETGVLVLASMTFNSAGTQGFRTMMGVDPKTAVEQLDAAGADIIGTNCGGISIEDMLEIVREMKNYTSKPLLAEPNAGLPTLVDGETVYDATPDDMACYAPELVKAGANIIGGCCGTTPAHIAAIAKAIKK